MARPLYPIWNSKLPKNLLKKEIVLDKIENEKYEKIKSIIDGYAHKIGAPSELLPSYGKPKNKIDSYVEIYRSNFMRFVVRENRFRVKRLNSNNLKLIFFWVFDRVTYRMAYRQLASKYIDSNTLRNEVFKEQKRLLKQINEEYEGWCEQKDCKIRKTGYNTLP